MSLLVLPNMAGISFGSPSLLFPYYLEVDRPKKEAWVVLHDHRSLACLVFCFMRQGGKIAPVIARAARTLDRRRRRCIESTIVLSLRWTILVEEQRLMQLTRFTKEIKCGTTSVMICRFSLGKLALFAFLEALTMIDPSEKPN